MAFVKGVTKMCYMDQNIIDRRRCGDLGKIGKISAFMWGVDQKVGNLCVVIILFFAPHGSGMILKQ